MSDATTEEDDLECDIAILGAGFSGSLVAVHLSREHEGPSVVLIERSQAHGRGLAYGAASPRHLLNVPAGRMSAFPDEPDHFLRWLKERPDEAADFAVVDVQAKSFLPRRLYGRYLTSLVTEAAHRVERLHLVDAEAVDIQRGAEGGFRIALAHGPTIRARMVVFAAGNFSSAHPKGLDPALLQNPRYLSSPWAPDSEKILAAPGDVLVLGTGLTALDFVVTLERVKTSGHVYLLSRHGLLPNPHRTVNATGMNFSWRPLPETALETLQRVRVEVDRASAEGIDWRAVVDSLRGDTQAIWQQWTHDERRRFLRHLRPYWEVARHRAAPETFAIVESLRKNGRLTVQRGRIERIDQREDRICITFTGRQESGPSRLHVDAVVNCTGPQSDLRRVKDVLVMRLIQRGLIRADSLGLGMDVTGDGQAIDATGCSDSPLFAMGALRKGLLWETTAVPELRTQAADLAKKLLSIWRPVARFQKPKGLPALETIWAFEI